MANAKLNKIASLHLKASGIGEVADPDAQSGAPAMVSDTDEDNPQVDTTNGTDTPSKKVKGPKERDVQTSAKESSVSKKPKGIHHLK